jgi:DNA-directed RNA polymerase specialized sigma subunit
MNIPVKLHGSVDPSGRQCELESLGNCILNCQTGDLREHMRLARIFRPLIRTLAEKRAGGPDNVKEINRLCALGREGLYEAILEYTPKVGISRFRVFALDYIERAMDSKPKGFWQNLFRLRFPKPR